jgi:hypothetical protein
MQLAQNGTTVTGGYVVDGSTSRGRISGNVSGSMLTFTWDQDGGFTGSGQFLLSPDGSAFRGSYTGNPHPALTPDLLTGSWQGQRQ